MEMVVVGAGPAGLAAAGAARQRGREVQVLEASGAVGATWRQHYDRLHLHTTRRLSALPGQEIPAAAGTWVSRDDFIAYLEDYARRQDIPIRFHSP
ncbi:MAG TPA: NAD(P)-binding domain-containing protein, partial [Candidatus Dormibacteraeota bacterium]